MRDRISNLRRRAGVALARAWSAVRGEIGREEIYLLAALLLIAAGFWQLWRPGSFLLPGAVLLWIALPTRARFVERPIEPKKG